MLNNKAIQEDADFLKDMGDLCVAYEQISVMKMKKIKDVVLYTRDFYSQLSEFYVQLKNTYRHQVMTLIKEQEGHHHLFGILDKPIKDPKKMLLFGKNEKTVSIFISANNKLYGDIMNKVFFSFLGDIKNNNTDIIVAGKLGKKLYEDSGAKKPYKYFEVPDDGLVMEHLKPLLTDMVKYSIVNVYFGLYESFFNQRAIKKNISGDIESPKDEEIAKKDFYYFEPNLEKTLYFFETQIFANLFKQSTYEGQLARHASRVGAMEQALASIEKDGRDVYRQRRKDEKSIAEKQQNERLSKIMFRNQI